MLICIVCLFLSCLKNLNTSHVNVNPRIRKNIGGNIMSKGWYPVIDYDKCVGCMKVATSHE